ncbi:MAG TPA: hypothetical protein VGF34_11330 [Stellaceae bacterium]|jgi:hypothetical protein
MTTLDENRELLLRWFNEFWNAGREDLIDEFTTPNVSRTGSARRRR